MNLRIDKETGEPILSPKLTAMQLHAMANDLSWHPWMYLVAGHSNSWPALKDWWQVAQRQGFDIAGPAPMPPESSRGRTRVAIPTPPLPPEGWREPGGQNLADASLSAPTTPEPSDDDAQTGEPESPAETESAEAPDDAGQPAADTGSLPWKRILIIAVAVILATGVTAASLLFLHHRHETLIQQTQAQTVSDCEQARTAADKQRDALESALAEARELAGSTDPATLSDPTTLDELNKLAGAGIPQLAACTADNPDTAGIAKTGEDYETSMKALADAADKVNESKLDKTVADAQRLHDDSAGKVADEQTRTNLAQAIERRDPSAIQSAMDKVNESIKTKEDADRAQAEAQAQAEARAQAEQQQERQSAPAPSATSRPRRSNSSNGGTSHRTTGGTSNRPDVKPSTPAAPAPQPAPAAPQTPSRPSGNNGAVVG